MIHSFKDKETEKIFYRNYSRKFPKDIQRIAMRKLWMIDAAIQIKDLRIPPGNFLKRLKGKNKKYFSIRINRQWRICFLWEKGGAYNVFIQDYH